MASWIKLRVNVLNFKTNSAAPPSGGRRNYASLIWNTVSNERRGSNERQSSTWSNAFLKSMKASCFFFHFLNDLSECKDLCCFSKARISNMLLIPFSSFLYRHFQDVVSRQTLSHQPLFTVKTNWAIIQFFRKLNCQKPGLNTMLDRYSIVLPTRIRGHKRSVSESIDKEYVGSFIMFMMVLLRLVHARVPEYSQTACHRWRSSTTEAPN